LQVEQGAERHLLDGEAIQVHCVLIQKQLTDAN
jgi:hypothetical protein